MGRLFRYAIGLSPTAATFSRRGFHAFDPCARERLEAIGQTFIKGYNHALRTSQFRLLVPKLEDTEPELRGFAFEGAATALALLDQFTPWSRRRLQFFIAGPASRHIYMAYIGAGWAIARIPWLHKNVDQYLLRLDPLLGWLAIDGYGFEAGFFHRQRHVVEQKYPAGLSEYAKRVFDQGLGRSLWFVDGADAGRIPVTISSFAEHRRADLWSGVGLGCTYAGGADQSAIESLRDAAGSCAASMGQGAAFAAKARQHAGNEAQHTDVACRILCGVSADEAARVTDEARKHLPNGEKSPSYEIWRQKIQAKFVMETRV